MLCKIITITLLYSATHYLRHKVKELFRHYKTFSLFLFNKFLVEKFAQLENSITFVVETNIKGAKECRTYSTYQLLRRK